ncbi:MAG: hypothetical protein NT027_13065 [Proteobacteria bacterium]|nr:hypothetical protein [Pseudomonadota bacterium]
MSFNALSFIPSTSSSKVVLLAAIGTFIGCGKPHHESSTKSVEIPQTVIKSQGSVGFCWSYATIGFLESLALKNTGLTLDLSEEALGFYRMAEELNALSRKFKAEDLSTPEQVEQKVFEGLEGWDVTFNPHYNPNLPVKNAMQLIETYGTVPESAWSYKFTSGAQLDKFMTHVFTGFAGLMKSQGQGKVTRDMIFELLGSAEAYGSIPPKEFDFLAPNGKTKKYSSIDFASDYIGFSKDDYTYMIPDAQIGYDQLVSAMKLTLERGLNVPFSYIIFKNSFDSWDGSYSMDKIGQETPVAAGGHAVLVTDFINKGGRPGKISDENLKIEMSKASSELDFLIIKNSWGTDIQSPIVQLPGYHVIRQNYVRELSKTNTNISIVVPRDIAFKVRYQN